MVTPDRRRIAVQRVQQRFGVSERRACAVLGQHRSTQRRAKAPTDDAEALVSSGREPPPPALLEPYVTVSRHTAPTVRRSSASVDLSAPPPKG